MLERREAPRTRPRTAGTKPAAPSTPPSTVRCLQQTATRARSPSAPRARAIVSAAGTRAAVRQSVAGGSGGSTTVPADGACRPEVLNARLKPRAPLLPRPAVDHANRVASEAGASAPGRSPRLTNTIGAGAAFAIARRVSPRPSLRQRSDSPIRSRSAREAAATIPARPGSATAVVGATPANC